MRKYLSIIAIAVLVGCGGSTKKHGDGGPDDGAAAAPDTKLASTPDAGTHVDSSAVMSDSSPGVTQKDAMATDVSSGIPLDPNPPNLRPPRDAGDAGKIPEAGTTDAVFKTDVEYVQADAMGKPYKNNFDTIDGGPSACDITLRWYFPLENIHYCGPIGDACMFACDTTYGCRVDVEKAGTGSIQTVYCSTK